MRVVEMVSHADDRRGSDGHQDSASRTGGFGGSGAFGPTVDPGRRQLAALLRDKLAARRVRDLTFIEDLRSVVPPDAEAIRKARTLGQRYAAAELAECLGPDCTLFLGYENSGGAIGQLLLSPHALVAMTCLFLNATVHCSGDGWRADRFDDFEQFIGALSLDDRAGRSPSAQVNQPADVLESQLAAAELEVRVLRAIVLNHPRSRRGNCRRPTIEIFASIADFLSWLQKMPKVLDHADRTEIDDLIGRGHRA